MKKNTLLLLFIAITQLISAQDIIITKKSEKIKSTILEVGISTIKYKLFEDSTNKQIFISKNEVNSIIYANGTVESFLSDIVEENYTLKRDIGKMTYYKRWLFLDGMKVYPAEFQDMCIKNNIDAFKYYQQGRAMRTSGIVLVSVGPALLFYGTIFTATSYLTADVLEIRALGNAGIALMVIGAATLAGGITLMKIYKRPMQKCTDMFNNRTTSTTYKLNYKGNGIGFAINF